MPGMLKIGKTTVSPEARAKELSAGTGVPTPFIVAYDAHVSDCDEAERKVHDRLKQYRVGNDREFFAVPLKTAIEMLDTIETELPYTADIGEHLRRMGELAAIFKREQLKHKQKQDDEEKLLTNVRARAMNGDREAQKQLGSFYEKGRFVNQDSGQAREWLMKAAELGDTSVCFKLGKMCEQSHGVIVACAFYLIAARGGSAEASEMLQSFEDVLPAEQRSEIRRIAELFTSGGMRSYFEKGDPVAKRKEQREAEILNRTRLNAINGNRDAQRHLASIHEEAQNFVEARKWYRRAAEQGDTEICFNLGEMYHWGKGGPVEIETACALYLIAAKTGSAEAGQILQNLEKELSPQRFAEARRIASKINPKLIS